MSTDKQTAETTRTAYLERHGVPISMEFVNFVNELGELCDAAGRMSGSAEKGPN